MATRDALFHEIQSLISRNEGNREQILARLWSFQTSHCLRMQEHAELFGIPGKEPVPPEDIRAIHTTMFRAGDLVCFDAEKQNPVVEFRSSGTTSGSPSRHRLRTLDLYETALRSGFERAVPEISPGSHVLISMLPSAGEWPNSSLVHMFDFLMKTYNSEGPIHVGSNSGAPCVRSLDKEISKARDAKKAVLLLGTTLSHLHIIQSEELIDLPEGSLVLETGGTKNLQEYDSEEVRLICYLKTYGVAAEQILVEYGMAELGSQAYGRYGQSKDKEIRPTLSFPPWVLCSVRDPDSNQEVEPGGEGVLQILDPVNIDTCAFILTSDLVRDEGENRFKMLGRVRDANLRGCSLSVPSPDGSIEDSFTATEHKTWDPGSLPLDKTPPGTRIKALAETWAQISNLRDPEVMKGCERLADSMGLSVTHVHEALRRESNRWTEDHLAETLARETSPFAAGRIKVRPVDGAVIIPASTVPFVGLESLTVALLCGCNIAVKPSRRTEPELSLFLDKLEKNAPELIPRVHRLDPLDDIALTKALSQAESIVVHGDKEVISRVRRESNPNARIQAYGPRWSMAFLDPTDVTSPELLAALATDIILYDSLGCLSPRLIFVVGDQRETRWVAEALGTAIDSATRRFEPHIEAGRRAVGAGPLAPAIESLRQDPRGIESVHQHGTAHLLLAGAPLKSSPGLSVQIPVLRRGIILAALDLEASPPASSWIPGEKTPLSTVGISGAILRSPLGKVIEDFALRRGAARITTPDRFQTPPAGWPHDGCPLFMPFVRLVTPG